MILKNIWKIHDLKNIRKIQNFEEHPKDSEFLFLKNNRKSMTKRPEDEARHVVDLEDLRVKKEITDSSSTEDFGSVA